MSDDNEERKDDQGENVEENMSLEDMQAFVEGLNHFVHEVSSMDWPEAVSYTHLTLPTRLMV